MQRSKFMGLASGYTVEYLLTYKQHLITILKLMKNKFLLVVVLATALLVFQSKVIMPYIYDIAASDLFLEDTGDEKNDISSANLMTLAAFDQCNNNIASELLPDSTLVFSDTFINAFSLGSHQYVLNANLEIQPDSAPVFSKRYVCKIKYSKGNDTSVLNVDENWSIIGISGLANL